MNKKEEILQTAGETIEYARQFARQQIEYYRLELAERTAKTTASLITGMVVGVVFLLALVMLSIAVGFYLGTLLGSPALAFLCVSGFYLILGGAVYFFRGKLITNPILTTFLESFLD